MITYEFERNSYLLAKACNPIEKNRLIKAYHDIQKEIEYGGLTNKYGVVEVAEAELSAHTYYSISQSICRLEDKIIVDCGCGQGLQQVFFKNAKKYIGIDTQNTFFKICDNSEFIQGEIEEILPTLDLKDSIGISVLCAMCFPTVNEAMKKYFNELVIL